MQIKLQKTGYWVTDKNDNSVIIDGHSWFSKPIARKLAIEHGGMYYDGNKTSIKEVVVAL